MICIRCSQVNRQGARLCDSCGLALPLLAVAPAQSEMTSNPIKPLSDVFVRRDDEVARLTWSLEAALQGRGQLVALAGEPGIEKTRTARKLAATASATGTGAGGRARRHRAPGIWMLRTGPAGP